MLNKRSLVIMVSKNQVFTAFQPKEAKRQCLTGRIDCIEKMWVKVEALILLRQLNTSILSFRRKPESRWVLDAGSSPA